MLASINAALRRSCDAISEELPSASWDEDRLYSSTRPYSALRDLALLRMTEPKIDSNELGGCHGDHD